MDRSIGSTQKRRVVASPQATTTSCSAYDGGKRGTMALLSRVKLDTSANAGLNRSTIATKGTAMHRSDTRTSPTPSTMPDRSSPASLLVSLRDDDLRAYLANDNCDPSDPNDGPRWPSTTPEGVAGMPDWMRRQYLQAQRRNHRQQVLYSSSASPPVPSQYDEDGTAEATVQARPSAAHAQPVDDGRAPQRASSLSVHTMGLEREGEGLSGECRSKTALAVPARPVRLRSEVYRVREVNGRSDDGAQTGNEARSDQRSVHSPSSSMHAAEQAHDDGGGKVAPRCSSATFSFAQLPQDLSDAARHDSSPAVRSLLHRVSSATRSSVRLSTHDHGAVACAVLGDAAPPTTTSEKNASTTNVSHLATATTVVPRVLRNRTAGNTSPPHTTFSTFVVEDPMHYNAALVFSNVRPLSALATHDAPIHASTDAVQRKRTRAVSPTHREGAMSSPSLPKATPAASTDDPLATALTTTSPRVTTSAQLGTGVQLLDTRPLEVVRHNCEDDDPLLARMRRQALGPVDAVEALLQRVHSAGHHHGSVKRTRSEQAPEVAAAPASPDDDSCLVGSASTAPKRTSPLRHSTTSPVSVGMPDLQGSALRPVARSHRQTSPTVPTSSISVAGTTRRGTQSRATPTSANLSPAEQALPLDATRAVTVPSPGSVTPPFSTLGTPPVSTTPGGGFNDDDGESPSAAAPPPNLRDHPSGDGSSLPSSSRNASPGYQSVPNQHVAAAHGKMKLLHLPAAVSSSLDVLTPRGGDGGHSARRASVQRSPRLSLSVAGGVDALLATPRGSIVEQLMALSARRESAAAELAAQPPPPLVAPSGLMYAKTTMARLALVMGPNSMRTVSADALKRQQVAVWERANRAAGSESLDAVVAEIECEIQSIGVPIPDAVRCISAAVSSCWSGIALMDAAPSLFQSLNAQPPQPPSIPQALDQARTSGDAHQEAAADAEGTLSTTMVKAPPQCSDEASVLDVQREAMPLVVAASPPPTADATLFADAAAHSGRGGDVGHTARQASSTGAGTLGIALANEVETTVGGEAMQIHAPVVLCGSAPAPPVAVVAVASLSGAALHLSADESISAGGALMRSTTMPYTETAATLRESTTAGVPPPAADPPMGDACQESRLDSALASMPVVVEAISHATVVEDVEAGTPSFGMLVTEPSTMFVPLPQQDTTSGGDACEIDDVHAHVETPQASSIPPLLPVPMCGTVLQPPPITAQHTPAPNGMLPLSARHSASVPPADRPNNDNEDNTTAPPQSTTLLPPLKLRNAAVASPPDDAISPMIPAAGGNATRTRRASASAAPSKSPRRTSVSGGGGVSPRISTKESDVDSIATGSAAVSPSGALLVPDSGGGALSRTPRTRSPSHAGAQPKAAKHAAGSVRSASKSPRPQSAPKSEATPSRAAISTDSATVSPTTRAVTVHPAAVKNGKPNEVAATTRPSSAASQSDVQTPLSTPSCTPQLLSLDGDAVAPPALRVVVDDDGDDGVRESPRDQGSKRAVSQQQRVASGGIKSAPLKSPRGTLREPVRASRSRTPTRRQVAASGVENVEGATPANETPPAAAASLLAVDGADAAASQAAAVSPRKGNVKKGSKSPRVPSRGTRSGGSRGKSNSAADGRSKDDDDEERLEDGSALKVELMSDSDAEDGDDFSGPLQNSLDPVASILVVARPNAESTPEERDTKLRLRRSVIKHLAAVLQQDLRMAAMSVLGKLHRPAGSNTPASVAGPVAPASPAGSIVSLTGWGGTLLSDNDAQSVRSAASPLLLNTTTASSSTAKSPRGGNVHGERAEFLTRAPPKIRIAIVISIATYSDKSIQKNMQCEHEASAVASVLSSIGFVVTRMTMFSNQEELRPTSREAVLKCIQLATKGCKVGTDFASIVYACGGGFSGALPGSNATNNPQPVMLRNAGKLAEQLGTGAAFVLVPGNVSAASVTRESVLTLSDLMHVPSSTDGTNSWVIIDTYSVSFLPPCPHNLNGFGMVGGRKTIGGEMFCLYEMHHLLPLSLYLQRALSGWATRDSRLSVNGINAYVHGHLTRRGLFATTSASPFFVGDLDLATVHELRFCRQEIRDIRNVLHGKYATVALTLVPTRNQDPTTAEFVRQLHGAFVELLSSDADNPIVKCLHRTYAQKLVVTLRGINPVKLLGDDTALFRHTQAATIELRERLNDPSVEYRATCVGQLLLGEITISNVLAREEFLLKFENSKRIRAVKELKKAWLRTVQEAREKRQQAIQHQQQQLEAVMAARMSVDHGSGDTPVLAEGAVPRRTSSGSSTPAEPSLLKGGSTDAALVPVDGPQQGGKLSRPLVVATGTATTVSHPTPPPTPTGGLLGSGPVQRRTSGGGLQKTGESPDSFTPRVVMTSNNAFNINAAIEQAALQQAKPDVSRAAGFYSNPIDKGFQIDGKAVHEIGLVTCITFLTTEYLALKLDRAIRSHGLLSQDYLLKDVKISSMDGDHVQLHLIVAGFQSMWRGKQTRKKMQILFPVLREEVALRAKVSKEERDFVLKINAALVWSAQRIAIDAERTARGDVRDLEHQALTYLYMDRVSLYQRIAYQWFVSIASKLEATENVVRFEIVHRKNILWPALLHLIFLRKFIRILRDEDKARVKMVEQAENKIRNLGSQFWKVERKRW